MCSKSLTVDAPALPHSPNFTPLGHCCRADGSLAAYSSTVGAYHPNTAVALAPAGMVTRALSVGDPLSSAAACVEGWAWHTASATYFMFATGAASMRGAWLTVLASFASAIYSGFADRRLRRRWAGKNAAV